MVIVKQNEYRKPSSTRKPRELRTVECFNAFKFDPTRMIIGEINFSWETKIKDRLSLEFELGPTISNLQIGGGNHFIDNGPEARSKMGILLSGGLRYYPLDDSPVFNNLYVSPRVKFRRYNEMYHDMNDVLADQRAFSNELIFSFNVGYQQWVSEKFAFDYYFGLGIGSYRAKSYYIASSYNDITGEWTNVWDEQNEYAARLRGVIGIKVSICD